MRYNNRARGQCGSGMRMFPAFPGKVMLLTLTGLMVMLLWGNSPALAEEETVTEESPSAQLGEEEAVTEEAPHAQLGEEVTPMDKSFQEKPESRRPELLPRLKEQLKDTQPFFRDTKLDLNLRTYYASSDNYDDTRNEAWALGGSLSYRSGWFLDRQINDALQLTPLASE